MAEVKPHDTRDTRDDARYDSGADASGPDKAERAARTSRSSRP